MSQKPKHLSREYASVFKHASVVDAYKYRPEYPTEVFDILAGLIADEPRHVLDVGCGTGFITRSLIERVGSIDAVDFSQNMLNEAKRLPGGDNPGIRWIHGSVEEVELYPPYALITAGASLHWMEWSVVMPRFARMLTPQGYLAMIEHDSIPNPFDGLHYLRPLISRYSTNKDFQWYDLIPELEKAGLFTKVGEQLTEPMPFTQSIDEYIESYHARNGFSRERMGEEQATAFDREAKELLLQTYPDGVITLQVRARVTWGKPVDNLT